MAGKHANPGQSEAAAERRVRALELRKSGYRYHQIAAATGVSVTQAFYDVAESLRELAEQQTQAATDLRQLESERLDKLLLTLKKGIKEGNPQAIQAAVRIMERRAKLWGLDAPEKTQLGNLPGEAFKTYGGIDESKEPVRPRLPAGEAPVHPAGDA